MKERIVRFTNEGVELEGVLRYPDEIKSPVPCLVIIHGSLEHDRDGNLLSTQDGRQIYKKDSFLKIAQHLCKRGFSTFSWDKSGFAKSIGKQGDYFTQKNDAKSAIDKLVCENSDIVNPSQISVFGQSAGVYVQCLLAKEDNRPSSYILCGGLYSDYYDMMSYNYHRVRDYANKNKENHEWVEAHDLWGLKQGLNLDKMFDAISCGKSEWTMEYNGTETVIPINQKVYAEEAAPQKQFKYINKPALIIHGHEDLNVPVQDAYDIEKELRVNGNNNVELVIIPGVDHSFQISAEDEDTRLKERMSLESFKRPILEEYLEHLSIFLKRVYSK